MDNDPQFTQHLEDPMDQTSDQVTDSAEEQDMLHEEFGQLRNTLIREYSPKTLGDICYGDYSENHKIREAKEALNNIDLGTLQFLLMSNIRTSEEEIPCPEMLSYILEKKNGDIRALVAEIQVVIQNMLVEPPYGSNLEPILGNFHKSRELKRRAASDFLQQVGEDRGMKFLNENIETISSPTDEDRFEYQLIETIDRLATQYPQYASEWEEVFVDLLDVLGENLELGSGGMFYSDVDLKGNDAYADLDVSANRYFDNVSSYRIYQLIRRIGEQGTHRSVDALLSFMQKQSAYFIPVIATACSQIDSQYTIDQLQTKGLATHEDRFIRSAANAIWHRLEAGKIGIKKGVVTYLEKSFVLKGDISKAENARRITVDGKVGIFDKQGGLISYFKLGELADIVSEQDAALLEVSRDLLFSDADTPDDIRQQFLADYTDFYEKVFGEIGGIRMSDLTLREQVWMFQYWKNSTTEEWKQAKKLKETYGIYGVRVFIASEKNANIGAAIVSFAEDEGIEEHTKETVFILYNKIIAELDVVDARVKEFYLDGQRDQEVNIPRITDQIASRAYALLDTLLHADEKKRKQYLIQLQSLRANVFSFGVLFKEMTASQKKVDFEAMRGVDILQKDSADLTSSEREELRKMFHDNRLDVSSEFAKQRVEGEFDPVMTESGHMIYMLKKDDTVVAFARFDTTEDGNLYTGFVNAMKGVQGLHIGSAFFSEILDRQDPRKSISLVVRTENKNAVALYRDQLQFVVDGAPYENQKTGKEYIRMVRLPRSQSQNT